MLYLILSYVGLAYLCYVLFLAIMSLYRAKILGTLTKTQKALGYPLLYTGFFVDFLTNMVICTPLFLELPRETLVTNRIRRLRHGTDWRAKIAQFICDQLDNIDPTGCHCKE